MLPINLSHKNSFIVTRLFKFVYMQYFHWLPLVNYLYIYLIFFIFISLCTVLMDCSLCAIYVQLSHIFQ